MAPKTASANPATAKAGHTQKAYLGIRNMLFHNEIGPGQKISYRDLAERLGMSQTPVIQALKWLEFQQLVRHEPNRGYYTASVSLQEVEEIYDFRELIELTLLPVTLKRWNEQSAQRLKSAFEAHQRAAKEVFLYDRLEKDMAFHLTLASLSGCKVQHQTLCNLFDLLYLKYGGNLLFSTSMESAAADHERLFAHLAGGSLKGARQVLSRHIRQVKDHVLSGLGKLLEAKQKPIV